MLFFKLLTVPLFILIITLSGKRWGSEVAGTLGAFPVVAGPIVLFLTLEQGITFGANACIFAIYGAISILFFIFTYAWTSRYWTPVSCLISAMLAWFASAYALTFLPKDLMIAVLFSLPFLYFMPRLLPQTQSLPKPPQSLKDLPYRMLVGALLTIAITTLANDLGDIWSGILSVFPVVTLVLAVFTHHSFGHEYVVQTIRGISKGIYSFITYFVIYNLCIADYGVFLTIGLAFLSAIGMQFVVQHVLFKKPTAAQA